MHGLTGAEPDSGGETRRLELQAAIEAYAAAVLGLLRAKLARAKAVSGRKVA